MNYLWTVHWTSGNLTSFLSKCGPIGPIGVLHDFAEWPVARFHAPARLTGRAGLGPVLDLKGKSYLLNVGEISSITVKPTDATVL